MPIFACFGSKIRSGYLLTILDPSQWLIDSRVEITVTSYYLPVTKVLGELNLVEPAELEVSYLMSETALIPFLVSHLRQM